MKPVDEPSLRRGARLSRSSAVRQPFDVMANDVAVRLYPTSDLGDLQYPKGKAPAQLSRLDRAAHPARPTTATSSSP
ncbi:hypothetical protein BST30_03965 [Mycobacterium mantenii]|uniref:Uncharacterized protein n=1 Tax=Mycobacterium mantenii TaxID=560555 RepID=A0A1X0G329_MYCNT|nr:hypothetical protein BST30_03965 [Mycobacterium mantenii]